MKACIKIIDLYPAELGTDASSNIRHRNFWCHIISITACVDLGRAAADTAHQTIHYTSARSQINNCREYIEGHTQGLSKEQLDKLSEALPSLAVLDFECAIRLQQVANICAILEDCGTNLDPMQICVLADLVISSKLTDPVIYEAFRRITDTALSSKSPCDVLQQLRWLRCLYRLALQCEENCVKFIADRAKKLIDMATLLAPELPHTTVAALRGEMQWLPIDMYNESLLYFKDMKNQLSQEWYSEAIKLTKCIEHNGWDTDSLSTKMSEAYGTLNLAN
ncbi:uncharacterized protein MCYG_04267 [Microsporum canis CBS 113480]|uniref:Uncharacterized protein n=1 Tax=Arthroderma otae (strain ATCC MYA-4605 / CBS 113480) TaxID=554155 RepID=C5FPD2_ARTOC|nr:uncharacterized protein MCYG_04267 [Microsporum canis CBS 113480]EEQ31448.1 predicted protein [Microsporum canis CBS 113480]